MRKISKNKRKKKDSKNLAPKVKEKEKEGGCSSKKLIKKESHFATKGDIKRALLLKQSFYLLLSKETSLSTATIPALETIPPKAQDGFYIATGYLFKEGRLCIPQGSIRKLLVRESHEDGLMGHFGIDKTLVFLKEKFLWPHMKKYGHRYCTRCVACLQARSRVLDQVASE